MARRYKSLHHNLQPGENVVLHREHRSPRNRSMQKKGALKRYDPSTRRKWKNLAKSPRFLAQAAKKKGKRRRY